MCIEKWIPKHYKITHATTSSQPEHSAIVIDSFLHCLCYWLICFTISTTHSALGWAEIVVALAIFDHLFWLLLFRIITSLSKWCWLLGLICLISSICIASHRFFYLFFFNISPHSIGEQKGLSKQSICSLFFRHAAIFCLHEIFHIWTVSYSQLPALMHANAFVLPWVCHPENWFACLQFCIFILHNCLYWPYLILSSSEISCLPESNMLFTLSWWMSQRSEHFIKFIHLWLKWTCLAQHLVLSMILFGYKPINSF